MMINLGTTLEAARLVASSPSACAMQQAAVPVPLGWTSESEDGEARLWLW